MARRKWSELSDTQKGVVIAAAATQLALATAAWVDLARRPAELVRGPKPVWAAIIAVNFAGPIGYFAIGRRRV